MRRLLLATIMWCEDFVPSPCFVSPASVLVISVERATHRGMGLEHALVDDDVWLAAAVCLANLHEKLLVGR